MEATTRRRNKVTKMFSSLERASQCVEYLALLGMTMPGKGCHLIPSENDSTLMSQMTNPNYFQQHSTSDHQSSLSQQLHPILNPNPSSISPHQRSTSSSVPVYTTPSVSPQLQEEHHYAQPSFTQHHSTPEFPQTFFQHTNKSLPSRSPPNTFAQCFESFLGFTSTDQSSQSITSDNGGFRHTPLECPKSPTLDVLQIFQMHLNSRKETKVKTLAAPISSTVRHVSAPATPEHNPSISEPTAAHKCPDCGKEYSFRGNMQRHRKSAHQGKRYPCKLCGVELARRVNLLAHMRVNHQADMSYLRETKFDHKETYKCPICLQAFGYEGNLQQHLKIHGKAYLCEICGIGFKRATGLTRHKRSTHLLPMREEMTNQIVDV